MKSSLKSLLVASLAVASAFLAAPAAVSTAQAQAIGPLAPYSPPVVARGYDSDRPATIDPVYVKWQLDGEGDIQVCLQQGMCYYFSQANANGTRSYCNLPGGINDLRRTLRDGYPNQPVMIEFLDCYKGIPGGYWHGTLTITNNRTGQKVSGYVTELKQYRKKNDD